MTSARRQSSPPSADLEGFRIGRYEILARLATGGMAEVYLAKLHGAQGFERAVVLKRVLPHLAREEHFRQMFLDEARVVAAIAHPNVVQVHELGESGAELFLVMEYIAGESLSSVLRRLAVRGERLPPEVAAYLVAEAAAGLHAAHELTDDDGQPRNVVHRDVSPHNLMVTYDGQVKVLDFGIAKANDASTHTASGVMKGKFPYMAPEQYLREPVDRRTDIFSLGTVLWEASTSRRLFARDNDVQTLRAICDDAIPRLGEVFRGTPEPLEAVCAKALARPKDHRFQTAQELQVALVEAVREFAPDAFPRQELQRVMERLFAERREEKREMLRRVRAGSELTHVPGAEAGTEPTHLAPRVSKRARLGISAAALIASMGAGAYLALRGDEPAEEPVAVAAPAETVSVRIRSRPEGAEVRFGDTVLGVTPIETDVAATDDPVAVTFTLPGHDVLEERVVPDADVRLHVMLVPRAPEAEEPAADEPPAEAPTVEPEESEPPPSTRRRRTRRRAPEPGATMDPEYYRFD